MANESLSGVWALDDRSGASPMKQISKTILAVSIFIYLTAVSSTAQTVPNWAPNAAYGIGALVMLISLQKHCDWSPDHQGGLH
jgi:hypothetical protein